MPTKNNYENTSPKVEECLKKCAIFIRSVQDEDTISPEAHIRDCEEYIKLNGGHVVATFQDASIFDSETSRFEYHRFVKDVAANKFDCVIAKGTCCLRKDLKDTVRLLRMLDSHGVRLIAIDEDLDNTSNVICLEDIMVSIPREVDIVRTILEEIAQMFLEEEDQDKARATDVAIH